MSPKYSCLPEFVTCSRCRKRTGFCFAAVGNESTSVGPCFLRKFWFKRAIPAALTKQTVMPDGFKPSSLCTRRKNDSRGRSARRTSCCCFRIILAEFLARILSRTLLPGPLSRSRRHAADGRFHSLRRREGFAAPGCDVPRLF